jgi:Zn finger protein HypA/HybF involved in hydrogenase expression
VKAKLCKDCGESFEPIGRECICPECKQERAEIGEEDRKMRKSI